MTEVELSSGRDGTLKKFKANGHADFSRKGTDIVCSAVTILARTALQTLSQYEDVELSTGNTVRGKIEFSVHKKSVNPELDIRLKTVSDFLKNGFTSLSEEFPENVKVNLILTEA